MRTRALAVLPLLIASLGAGEGAKPPAPKGTWIEARTDHFVLFSNASEKQTRNVARQLESFRTLLGRIGPRMRLSSTAPTWVFVFDAEGSFVPYRPHETDRGAFSTSTDGNFAAFIARPYIQPKARGVYEESHFPYDTVFHWYAHYVFENNFPYLPRWLDEGLAQYYSTFRLTQDRNAEFGFPRPVHLTNLRYGGLWIPLEGVIGSRSGIEEELLVGSFYAESWLVVHYILNGSPTRRRQLNGYFTRLEQGVPSDRAFREAFETDFGGFTREIQDYLRSDALYTALMPLGDANPEASVRIAPMNRADVLTYLGFWLTRLGPDRYPDAEAHFRAALGVADAHASARAGLGYVLDRTGRSEEAETAYRSAIEVDDRNYLARFHFGWHLLARAISAPPETEATIRSGWLEKARENFSTCIAVQPEFSEAYFGFGLTFLDAPEPSAAGLVPMERAWHDLPGRMDVAYHVIRHALISGKPERAREALRVVLKKYPGRFLDYVELPSDWKWYQQFSVPPSRPHELATLVRDAISEISDPEIRSRLALWAAKTAPQS